MVPETCTLDFEIRAIAADSAPEILAAIAGDAAALTAEVRHRFPAAGIRIETINAYPGLDTPANSEAFALVRALAEAGGPIKVAFGTEGGLFQAALGMPVLVCGPGHMAQGHVPDEFVSRAQLARCDAMLAGMVDQLAV